MQNFINNANGQLGTYISQLYTPYYTDDQKLIKARDWVNEAIRRFKNKPATPQNCQILKAYVQEKLFDMRKCPVSKAGNELIKRCEDIVRTLQTGIDREAERLNEEMKNQGVLVTVLVDTATGEERIIEPAKTM